MTSQIFTVVELVIVTLVGWSVIFHLLHCC